LGKIKDTFWEVGLQNELCEHLKSIGLNARIVDQKGEDGLRHTPTLGVFGNPPLCQIRVEGKNFDYVELYRAITPQQKKGFSVTIGPISTKSDARARDQLVYIYSYAVKADVGDKAKEFETEAKIIEKGMIKKEFVGMEWRGKKLAEALNSDPELKNMMYGIGVPHVKIEADKKDKYVGISVLPRRETSISIAGILIKHQMTVGRRDFPSGEAIKVYDRIAQHVKEVAGIH